MLHLFRLLLPYVLVLFFAYKGTKEPLYFLGIPFLMFMSDSLFFNKAKLFHNPGSLDDQLIFIWLIVLWIFAKIIDKNPSNNLRNSQFYLPDICIAILIIITIIDFLVIVLTYPIITNVVREFFTDISLFVSYFIIKNWTSSNKVEVIKGFLYYIVIVNTIAALLYVLQQGLHFNIYPVEEDSMSEIFRGEEVIRNFYFMPQFLFFSITYILIFTKKYSIIPISILVVNLLAIFISYTRSYVIEAGFIFILFIVLTSLKKRKFSILFKNILLYGLLLIIGVFTLSKFFPSNTQYLMHRFSDFTQSSAERGEQNDLNFRFTNTAEVISKIGQNKKILGMGPITEAQSSKVVDMRATTADMVWTGVIFRWGIAGLVLFILIYIFAGFKAFQLFMSTEGVLSDLSLLFFIYILSQIIESFVSWTFLSGHGITTGLWYFALLSTLSKFKTSTVAVDKMHIYQPYTN